MKEVFFDESTLGSWLHNNPTSSRSDTDEPERTR